MRRLYQGKQLRSNASPVITGLQWPLAELSDSLKGIIILSLLVDLRQPSVGTVSDLRQLVDAAGAPVILGCGMEPNLAEIMTCHPAEKLN